MFHESEVPNMKHNLKRILTINIGLIMMMVLNGCGAVNGAADKNRFSLITAEHLIQIPSPTTS